MELNFKLSEFCITSDPLPIDVADKILKHHILPMQVVRDVYGKAISVSDHSGYRPKWHEIKRGRSGNSQHCYTGQSKGAVDWTAADLDLLYNLILDHTEYRRVCIYPNNGFIHCDYKSSDDFHKENQVLLFTCKSPSGKWKYVDRGWINK